MTGPDQAAIIRLAPGILRAAGLGDRPLAGASSADASLGDVTRLAGGSKKGVYRLRCDDGFSAVLYVWTAAEDYWPQEPDRDREGVFAHASGLGLFEACSRRLAEAGVRVPVVYLADRSHALYPADIALVEDVRGGTLEELMVTDPRAAVPVMEQLGGMLRSMWQHRAARAGRIADVDVGVHVGSAGDGPAGPSAEQIVLDRALRHLGCAADRVPALAGPRPQLDQTLRALAASVRPRAEYALIHGELGPDHVFIDDLGQPVVIDIEGAMYFDLEWEHAFLRLRFGRHYERLRVSGLDEPRMSLYALALDLSLVDGPLRLLDGGYPDREPMLAIAQHAIDRVLDVAGRQR